MSLMTFSSDYSMLWAGGHTSTGSPLYHRYSMSSTGNVFNFANVGVTSLSWNVWIRGIFPISNTKCAYTTFWNANAWHNFEFAIVTWSSLLSTATQSL